MMTNGSSNVGSVKKYLRKKGIWKITHLFILRVAILCHCPNRQSRKNLWKKDHIMNYLKKYALNVVGVELICQLIWNVNITMKSIGIYYINYEDNKSILFKTQYIIWIVCFNIFLNYCTPCCDVWINKTRKCMFISYNMFIIITYTINRLMYSRFH